MSTRRVRIGFEPRAKRTRQRSEDEFVRVALTAALLLLSCLPLELRYRCMATSCTPSCADAVIWSLMPMRSFLVRLASASAVLVPIFKSMTHGCAYLHARTPSLRRGLTDITRRNHTRYTSETSLPETEKCQADAPSSGTRCLERSRLPGQRLSSYGRAAVTWGPDAWRAGRGRSQRRTVRRGVRREGRRTLRAGSVY